MFIPGAVIKVLSYPGFIAANYIKRHVFKKHEIALIEFEPFDLLEEPIFILMPEKFSKYYYSLLWQLFLILGIGIGCLEVASMRIHWVVELIMVWLGISFGAHAFPRFKLMKQGWSSVKEYSEIWGNKWVYCLLLLPLTILSLLGSTVLGSVYLLLIYFEFYG